MSLQRARSCTAHHRRRLGGLEFPAGQHVTIATADLKDAFYHLSLPVELRPYFSLNPVSASSVGITQVNGITVGPKCKITPRLAVVPMGWTWALFLCQSVHEALAEKAGLGEKNRIRDRHVPPKTDCCHTQYVDNMIVLGTDKDSVLNSYDNAVDCLKQAGLQVHDEEVGEGATILGWEITKDCQFQPSRRRAWKVRFAIRRTASPRAMYLAHDGKADWSLQLLSSGSKGVFLCFWKCLCFHSEVQELQL